MEPNNKKNSLLEESVFGMGKTAVSWHSDSSLQDFSTIGVFNANIPDTPVDWKVGLRVSEDKVTPAIRFPVKSGDVYFMLGDFNHHHQHAVIAGSSLRYSSTHRVGNTEKDTWQYIWKRVHKVFGSATRGIGKETAEGAEVWCHATPTPVY
jgi:alpha-ketoglutarate-dependent dioxygenase FTO